MAKQSLMWTALPNGFDSTGALRVSALLSPRLEPDEADQHVRAFNDFVNWPAAVQDAKFTIQYGTQSISIAGNQTDGPARVDKSIDLPDSQTWTALIPGTTFVRGYKFQDLSNNAVLSYDTLALHSLVETLYVTLGKSTSEDLPKVSQFLNDPSWRSVLDAVATIDRGFIDEIKRLRDPAKQFSRFRQDGLKIGNPVTNLLACTQLFHTPPATPEIQDYTGASLKPDDPRAKMKGWRTYRRTKLPAPTDFAKEIDFHQIVAAMNQYPRLLRRLGLVIDFIIPQQTFASSPNQPLSVVCQLATPAQASVTRAQALSRTRTRLTTTQFDSVPRATLQAGDYRVQDRLLVINAEFFGILQTDIDAAGLKIMNFARTLGLMDHNPARQIDAVTKFEKEVGAPALRNAGLMLVQRRRAQMLTNAFIENKKKNLAISNGQAPDLFAQDVIRGWRIDIWDDKTEKWHSLCQRRSSHLIAGSITVPDDHEGMIRLAATKTADPASNPDIVYLHEALVSWTGWSLVAPQPGRLIDKSDNPADADQEVPPGILLENTFVAAPGTLPRLRYGRRYWIRARMTDLAANSLPPSEKDYGPELPKQRAVPYFRFEPVQAPSLALVRSSGEPEKPAEGESMERIAIRSFNATPADNMIPAKQVARRYAVAARSSVKEAELHGMLDSGGKMNSSQVMFDILAVKDEPLEEVKLPTPGPLATNATTATLKTSYAVLDESAKAISYLPDPLCVMVAARLFDHPGFRSTTIISIPAYAAGSAWPNAAPFMIRVIDNPSKTIVFDPTKRVLEISLPKAIHATLRLSCQLSSSALSLMGVWNWLPAADRAALMTKAQNGQHWMVSPWRTIELVHAVQKPLIAPEMKLSLSRRFGETCAQPRFIASCSLKSTSRLDLQAAWHEPDEDSDATEKGLDRARADHAFSIKITDAKSYAMRKFDPKATGIPEHDIAGEDLISVGHDPHHIVTKYHEFNDTRYRRVHYWLEATTRFREFMPRSILTKNNVETDENIKVTGPSVVAWIPNSAPPPAPQILYLVPTFGWVSSSDATTETRRRHGGGIRVYLDRPWNVSGYGEMLAVVLPPAAFKADPNTDPVGRPYKQLVTQWGNDPVWKSKFVSGPAPEVTNFPLARTAPDATGKWLPPFAPPGEADQRPGPFKVSDMPDLAPGPLTFDIAPHDVIYNSARRLWYCDIEVNFGTSYYPFVRLALARYQPTSVPNAHLSNIVLADFMALAPDRWLTVSHAPQANVRNVKVYGNSYSDSSGSKEAKSALPSVSPGNVENPAIVSPDSIVEVWVERFYPAQGEDFGWKREPEALISQTTAPPTIWPTLWNGTVTLPQIQPAGTRYRLVVAEYEEYLVDDATPYNATPSAKDRRLVFVEHVELGGV